MRLRRVWINGDDVGAQMVVARSPDRLAELLGLDRDRRRIRLVDDEEIEQIREALGDRAVRNIGRILRRLIKRLAPNADVEDIVGQPAPPWRALEAGDFVFLVADDGKRAPCVVEELECFDEGIVADRVVLDDGLRHWLRRP